jgi:type II secretory pathway pseudopilin PulG
MPGGHTLIELLTVFSILALVWLAFLPPAGRLQQSGLLFATAATIASELKTGQKWAESFHGKEKIIFFKNPAGFWNYEKTRTFCDNSEKTSPGQNLPEKIIFSSNFPGQTITFNNSGNPQKAGQITLGLAGFNKQRNIVVSPVGRIRITDAF